MADDGLTFLPAGAPGRLDEGRVYARFGDGCEVAFARSRSVTPGYARDVHNSVSHPSVTKGAMMLRITDDRHPGTRHFARLFSYDHIPEGPLRTVSKYCSELAQLMVNELPDGPELTAGLRKLLESKDCFVRAALEP